MRDERRTAVHRRKIRIIDKVFQYRTIAILLVVVLCGLAAFTAGALVLSAALRGQGSASSGQPLLSIFPPILLNDIVIMVLLIVAGVFLTHRIAGPVFRVLSDIDRVLAGEKRVRVRFRRTDAFPELAEKVNQLIERIDDTSQR
jgi:methyl-accepting chemotaxis protein